MCKQHEGGDFPEHCHTKWKTASSLPDEIWDETEQPQSLISSGNSQRITVGTTWTAAKSGHRDGQNVRFDCWSSSPEKKTCLPKVLHTPKQYGSFSSSEEKLRRNTRLLDLALSI